MNMCGDDRYKQLRHFQAHRNKLDKAERERGNSCDRKSFRIIPK